MSRHYHVCAVADCRQVVPKALLMCVRHWELVPAGLQVSVHATHRRWRRYTLDHEAKSAYDAAREVAVTAVESCLRGGPGVARS